MSKYKGRIGVVYLKAGATKKDEAARRMMESYTLTIEHGAFDNQGRRVGDYWQQTDSGIVPMYFKKGSSYSG